MPIDSDKQPFIHLDFNIPPDTLQPEESPSAKKKWRKKNPASSYIPKKKHWNLKRPSFFGRSSKANQPPNHLSPQQRKYVQDSVDNQPIYKTPPTGETRTSEFHVQANSTQRGDDRRDLAEATTGLATEVPALDNAIRQELAWKELRELFYPDLGSTPEEEKAIFLESLEHVTKGLNGDEKYKAVLIHIQERFKETGFSYGLDIDTEGTEQHISTISEILEGNGQGLDCEDFSVMAKFWGDATIEKGYLPEGSEFHIILGASPDRTRHIVCVFEAPEGDKYIIDGTLYDSNGGGNPSKLLTLAEFRDGDNRLDSLFERTLEFDEAQPEKILAGDTEVTEEWMNQSSGTPIDDSISDYDLKEKIYGQYGVDTDPHVVKAGVGDYLAKYAEEEFWQEKFDDFADNPDALGADIGSAVAEGTLATAFALYKRRKIIRRRNNIIKAFKVKQKWHDRKPINDVMTLSDFKDFGRVSHLVGNQYSSKSLVKVTADIFNCHKSYRTHQEFQNLVNNLSKLFPSDAALRELLDRITLENMGKPDFVKNVLERKLKEYGISVEYEKAGTVNQKIADKFRSMKNKKLKACLHRTTINKEKLYKKLKNGNCLLKQPNLYTVISDHETEIDTFYQLKNYDDWKLKFVQNDVIAKATAAATGIIPLLPIDETIRAVAYGVETNHRERNRENMEKRVSLSLGVLTEHRKNLNQENYQRIKSHLENMKELKARHIGLKEEKTKRMAGIHTASAIATPLADILGPAGSAGKNVVKGTLKIANTVDPMVRRYKGDKAQKQANRFQNVQDVYKLYKELYLQALKKEDINLQNTVLELASVSFDLSANEFHTLTQTSLVENNRFKLSFSRPLDTESRVYRAEQRQYRQ